MNKQMEKRRDELAEFCWGNPPRSSSDGMKASKFSDGFDACAEEYVEPLVELIKKLDEVESSPESYQDYVRAQIRWTLKRLGFKNDRPQQD